jgi:hypothetical protein
MHGQRFLVATLAALAALGASAGAASAAATPPPPGPAVVSNVPPSPSPSPSPHPQALSPGAKDAILAVNRLSGRSAVISCFAGLLSGLIPGAQPALPFLAKWCAGSLIVEISAYVAHDDPPDPNFGLIALQRRVSQPARNLSPLCSFVRGRTCRRLLSAARHYLRASRNLASATEALAITANRSSGALAAGSAPGQVLQSGVAKTYCGIIAVALTRERVVGRVLARRLRRAGVNFRLSLGQVRRVQARLAQLRGVPRSILTRLGGDGLDTPLIQQAIRDSIDRAISQSRRFDFQGALRQRIDATELLAEQELITIAELSQMVATLNQQGVISNYLALTLNADIQNYQLAPGPAERASAIADFTAHVAGGLSGPYSRFLRFAAAPLGGTG